jgi:hypothetical protein
VGPVEIEAGADVAEDFRVGIFSFKILDLSLKVGCLVDTGDSGITDSLFDGGGDNGRVKGFLFLIVVKDSIETFGVVESFSSWQANTLETFLFDPFLERLGTDIKFGLDVDTAKERIFRGRHDIKTIINSVVE